jgi:putative transposase
VICGEGARSPSVGGLGSTACRPHTGRVPEPGKPVQNVSIESVDGRFRDECLNLHWVRSLQHARQEIARWRDHDDTVRPPSAPGYLSPREVLTITTATAPGTPAVSALPLNT